MPNFVKICQSVAKILRFINFSRRRSPPSWIFKFVKFYWLTVCGGPRRITVPNFAKIGCSVAEILQFFRIFRWPPPPSFIFVISKIYWLLGWRGPRRISVPNFIKIGESVAKILRFLGFLTIFKFVKFCWAQTHHHAKCRQNRSIRCGDIAFFRIFKMAAATILDF